MKLIYKTTEFVIENEKMLEQKCNEIINDLERNNLYFDYFIVNGNNFYGELHEYQEKIEVVQIQYLDEKEYVNQLFLDLETYLKRATPALQTLSESMYQGTMNEDIWGQMGQLAEGIHYIHQVLDFIYSKQQKAKWNDLIQKWYSSIEVIENITNAMEEKDTVTLGDLIQYELMPLFEETSEKVSSELDLEGVRHDVN